MINAGAYCINKTSLPRQPGKFSFEEDYLKPQRNRLGFYTCQAYFIDIGIPEDYYRACEYFKI